MDIVSHFLSGVAVGTLAAAFSDKNIVKKIGIVSIASLGSILPDIDAISLWHGFDKSFGRLFHLQHSGADIYSATYWYSHHCFMHSVFAALLISFIAISFVYLLRLNRKTGFLTILDKKKGLILAFILGFIIHLLEDMPTPGGSWQGIAFFWPSARHIGGTGQIWWWNNYDLFLVIASIAVTNLTLLFCSLFYRFRYKLYTSIVFCFGTVLLLFQLNTRNFDYNNPNITFAKKEIESKEGQKKILGSWLYGKMTKFDKSLRINF